MLSQLHRTEKFSLRSLLYGGVFVAQGWIERVDARLRSLLYGGVLLGWLDRVDASYVSDPCCTAGFLLIGLRSGALSKVSDPCCTAGLLLATAGDFEALECLRSLLYGGVFVANGKIYVFGGSVSGPCCTAGFLLRQTRRGGVSSASQIPAVRRGFVEELYHISRRGVKSNTNHSAQRHEFARFAVDVAHRVKDACRQF